MMVTDVAQRVHVHVRIPILAQGRRVHTQTANPHRNVVGRRRDLVRVHDRDPRVLGRSHEVLDLQVHALHPYVSESRDRVAVRRRDAECAAAVRHRQVATPTIHLKHPGFIFCCVIRLLFSCRNVLLPGDIS